MIRINVICLPDAIIALPAPATDTWKESTMAPTRSFVKGNGCPAWIYSTSDEIMSQEDYNSVQRHLCFGLTPEGENTWYMNRLQTLIKNAFANIAIDPQFKDNSGS